MTRDRLGERERLTEILKNRTGVAPTDDDLERTLEASISITTSFCDSTRYGVMASYHQLKRLRGAILHAPKRFFDDELLSQIRVGLEMAENDHRKHVEKGTCVEAEIPVNSRTAKRGKKTTKKKGRSR